jgi:hypothetical protein
VSGLADVRILDVWGALGGNDLRRGRGRAFWRNGDGFNVSLDAKRGLWHDFVTGEGGGVAALVQAARGCDRREALQWLEAEGFVEPRVSTPAARRAYAIAREHGRQQSADVVAWHRARCFELESAKARALQCDDLAALEAAASELWRLQGGSEAEVVHSFQRAIFRNPTETRRLIEAGRADLDHCERVARLTVGLLALEREAQYAAA